MFEIVGKASNKNIATVYVAKNAANQYLEFVESVQPPLAIKEKWVLIVSTLFGCPIACPMCDAGGFFSGKLSKDEIFAQIDFLISQKFPDKQVKTNKFKIQFARMGEPTLNPAVLEVLAELPHRYAVPGLLPSFSTVAPSNCDAFLEALLEIKNRHYRNGNFQMQFSIHTTDQLLRDLAIPVKKWDFAKIAAYGEKFYLPGDQKITLNFALAKNSPIIAAVLRHYFDPQKFLIKITPINPTINAVANDLESYFKTGAESEDQTQLLEQLKAAGYTVILSIGELEENKIGSNCGQYIKKVLGSAEKFKPDSSYTYDLE